MTTTFVDNEPSSLASMTITSQVVTGIFLWLIRGHFSSPDNIVSSALRDFVYKDRDPSTGITIEPSVLWNPSQVEARPAVYVRRAAWKAHSGSLSINNMYQSKKPTTNLGDNGDRYELLISGGHSILCVARRGAEAEELASEVFFRLVEFAPVIQRDFNFHKFTVDDLGEIAKLEESSEHWAVPVGVSYAFAHGWLLKLLGPYLKSVGIHTEAV